MRRRRNDEAVPEHLERFIPADWPGHTWQVRFDFWREARRAHMDAHGWPGGPLELARGESDVRRRRDGQHLLSWGRTRAELVELDPEHRRVHLRPSRRSV